MPSYLVNSPFWTLILSDQLHPFAESNLTNDNGILYHYERLEASSACPCVQQRVYNPAGGNPVK
jgi:hypothetical protein